jgi:hypothetical protein
MGDQKMSKKVWPDQEYQALAREIERLRAENKTLRDALVKFFDSTPKLMDALLNIMEGE